MAPKKKVSSHQKDGQSLPPPPPPPAVQRSPLSIPELLWMILAKVPVAELIPIRAVSRQWTQVIGSICATKQALAVGSELMTLDEQSLQKRLTVHCYSRLFEHNDDIAAGTLNHQFTVVPMKELPDGEAAKAARHRLYDGLSTLFPSVTELYLGAMANDGTASDLLLWLPHSVWAPRLTRLSIECLVPDTPGFDLDQALSALPALTTLEMGSDTKHNNNNLDWINCSSSDRVTRLHHLGLSTTRPIDQRGSGYYVELTPATRSFHYAARYETINDMPVLFLVRCQTFFTKHRGNFASLTRLGLVNFQVHRVEIIEFIYQLGIGVSPQLRWLELGLYPRAGVSLAGFLKVSGSITLDQCLKTCRKLHRGLEATV